MCVCEWEKTVGLKFRFLAFNKLKLFINQWCFYSADSQVHKFRLLTKQITKLKIILDNSFLNICTLKEKLTSSTIILQYMHRNRIKVVVQHYSVQTQIIY